MWLVIAVIGYLALAIVNILDKFILEKAIKYSSVFVFYSSIIVLPILLFMPFGISFPESLADWGIAIISGFAFAFALWAMYIAFQKSEVSHAGPLNGASVAIFVLILSYIFLSESLNATSLAAFGLLVFGSLIISREKSNSHRGWHAGMTWAVFSGLLYAVSHVAAKYMYDKYGFMSGLVWTRGAFGAFGILLLLSPAVQNVIKGFFSGKKDRQEKQTRGKAVTIIVNRVLAVVGVLLVQWAIALGSVTLVNALAGLQYAAIVLGMMVLTKFKPNFIKEDYTRGEIIFEMIAVLFIGAGLALLV